MVRARRKMPHVFPHAVGPRDGHEADLPGSLGLRFGTRETQQGWVGLGMWGGGQERQRKQRDEGEPHRGSPWVRDTWISERTP